MTEQIRDAANQLMADLTADVSITIPTVDLSDDIYSFPGDITSRLYEAVQPLTNEELTTRTVDGSGTFDAIMAGVNAHLGSQYDKGRITGDEYAKVFLASMEAAMVNSVQFLVSRDTTFWAAQTAQLQAITARVQLETEKLKLVTVQIEALNAKANYALTKTQLVIASTEHATLQFRLDNMLPKEVIALDKQNQGLELDNATKTFNLDIILPTQQAGLELDNSSKNYNLTQIMPIDKDTKSYTLAQLLPAQLSLVKEQYEVQRAQTLDNRSDAITVTGTLGKQKDLYTQQIESYKRNAEFNAAKIFSDSWLTQKTLDEGLTPPNAFTNASIDTVLNTLKVRNGL